MAEQIFQAHELRRLNPYDRYTSDAGIIGSGGLQNPLLVEIAAYKLWHETRNHLGKDRLPRVEWYKQVV